MKQPNLTYTVIGLFHNNTAAEAAMEDLIKGGFVREDTELSNREMADANTKMTATKNDADIGGSLRSFFSSLFGDDSDVSIDSDAFAKIKGILTVQADSQERAEKAVEILDGGGAIDVNERADQYLARKAAAMTNKFNGDLTNPLIEECLRVGKRAAEQSGISVHSRIIENRVGVRIKPLNNTKQH